MPWGSVASRDWSIEQYGWEVEIVIAREPSAREGVAQWEENRHVE